MSRSKKTLVYIAALLTLTLANNAFASTYTMNGKEISKGEAVKALIKNPSALVTKTDIMEFSDKSGGLKAKKASKK